MHDDAGPAMPHRVAPRAKRKSTGQTMYSTPRRLSCGCLPPRRRRSARDEATPLAASPGPCIPWRAFCWITVRHPGGPSYPANTTDITNIVPLFTATCRGLRANGRAYVDALMTAWVQLGLHDVQCLNSLFLTSSRHLALRHQDAALQGQREMFNGMAVRYKVMSVRAVSRAIAESGSRGVFQDEVFMKTLALVFDEVGRDGRDRGKANRRRRFSGTQP